jgi:hypothetical protein
MDKKRQHFPEIKPDSVGKMLAGFTTKLLP